MEQAAGGASSSRYWCHMCSQRVNPMLQENEVMKCPICESGFVEEILEDMHMHMHVAGSGTGGAADHIHIHDDQRDNINNSSSDAGALSLWAPILLGMIANPIRLHQRSLTDNDDGEDHDDNDDDEQALLRRRRRRSSAAAVLQLLQSIRAGMVLDHQQEQSEQAQAQGPGPGPGPGGVIFINPFINQLITTSIPSSSSSSSLGDYFIGPGLDLLLQHLSENDPNRYGTPPAHKDALDALPTFTIQEDETAEPIQCAVCLDECEVGAEVKEMPCKHKFHSTCILPWLQLHSSCPVCRYQLPADDSKLLSHPSSSSSSATANHDHDHDHDHDNDDNNNNNNGPGIRRFAVPLLWPFTTLFTSSTSQPTTPTLITHPASTDHAPPTSDNHTSS